MVSVSIITMNRPIELRDTILNILNQTYKNLEIIIFENGSNPETIKINNNLPKLDKRIKYISNDKNLGVSGGRNEVFKIAKGDIIIEIDDDAIYEKEDAIELAAQFLNDNPKVGIIAFKVTNYYSKQVTRQEYPFFNKKRNINKEGECTWFIGTGHAFRKSLIDEIGAYRDFAPWGEEEQDLSLRALDFGYTIYYFPKINVLHKKTQTSRVTNAKGFGAIHLKNRVKVALLNLPWYSIISYFIMRSGQFVLITYRSPSIPIKAIYLLIKEYKYIKENRCQIKKETIRKLKNLHGQLYF